MKIDDRFEVFKEACKAMDEGKWKQAEVGFRLLSDYCCEKSLKEERPKARDDSK